MDSTKIIVKSSIYPLDVIYSAAYVFLDRAYIVLDGDPKSEIIVEISLKEGGDSQKIAKEFSNELLNYAFYKKQLDSTYSVREMILQRALAANVQTDTQDVIGVPEGDEDFSDLEGIATPWEDTQASTDLDEVFEEISENDPDGIAVPWDEKYGEKK